MKPESRILSIMILFVFLITLLSTPSVLLADTADAVSSSRDSGQLTTPRPGMLADYPDSYTRVEWETDTVTTNWNNSDSHSYWEFGPSISWETRNLTTGLLTEWNETIGLDVWVDFEVRLPFTSLAAEIPYAVALQGSYFNMSEIESGPSPEDEPGIALMALYTISEARWDFYSSTNHSFNAPHGELHDNSTLQDVFGPPVDPFMELDNASSTYDDEGEESYWLSFRMRFNQSTTPGFYHFMALALDADLNPIAQSRGAKLTGRMVAMSFDELVDQTMGGYYYWSRLDDDGNPVYSATRGQDFNMTATILPASFDNVTVFIDIPNEVLVQRMIIGEHPVRTTRNGGWEYDEDARTYFWNAAIEIDIVEMVYGSYMAEEPAYFDAGVEIEYYDEIKEMMITEYIGAKMAMVYWLANGSWSTLYSYDVPYYEYNPHWEGWERFERHVFEPWPIDGSIPKSYILNETASSYSMNSDGHHVVNFRGHISEKMKPTGGLGLDSLWVCEEVGGQDGRRLVAYPQLPIASPEELLEYEQLRHMAVESPIALVHLVHQGQEYHPSWMFQSDIGETFTVKSRLQGGAEYVDDVDGVGFFMFGQDDKWGFDGANDWWQHSQVEIQVRIDNDGDSEITMYNHTVRTSWGTGEHYEWQYVEVVMGSGVWEWKEVLVFGDYWQEQLWDFETESWTSMWFPMYGNKSIMDIDYLDVDAIIYELDGNDLRIWFDITPLADMPHLEWEWDFFYGNLTWVTNYEEEWGEHTVLGWVEEPVFHYWNGTNVYVKRPVKGAAFRNNDTPAVYGRIKMPYIVLEGINESVQRNIQSSPEGPTTESVIFEEWDPEGYDEETGEYSGAWKYHLKLLNDTQIPIYDGREITIFNVTLSDGRWFESYHEWPEHMEWNGLDYMFAVNGTAIIGGGGFWLGAPPEPIAHLPATEAGLVVYANGTIPLYLATHPEWMYDHYVIHMNETWQPIDVLWNEFFGAYAYFNDTDLAWYVLWNGVHPFEVYAATYGPHEVLVPHHWTYYYAYTTVGETDYPLPAPGIHLMDMWDMDNKIPAQEFVILNGTRYEAVWIGEYLYDDGINPVYNYPVYRAFDGITFYNLTDYGYDPSFPWNYMMYWDLNMDLPWTSKANGSMVIPEILHHDWTIAYGHRNNETWEFEVDGYLNVTTGFYNGDYGSSLVYNHEVGYDYVETEYGEMFYYNQSLRVLFFNVTLANGTFFYTASPFPEEAARWNNDSADWEVDHFYMYDIDGNFKNWTTWTDFTAEIVVVNNVTKKGGEDEFVFKGVPRNVTSFDYHYFDWQDYTWHNYARDTVDRDNFAFLQAMNTTHYEVIDLGQDYDQKYNFPSWNFTVDGFTWFNVTGRRDMIFKAHQVWGHSQKLDYMPLPITVQKDQWRIVTGIPEWGMWDLDTWTINPDTGALDLDGDLETDDDQYYVKSTHSFQENFTMTEEYLWVDIFWEPNGSLFNDEFHMSSYTGKVTFSWEHSWADNHIWYYADTGAVVDASDWAQISDTLYDAWGYPKPGYWGISWMAENFTSDDLKQQALDEGWDWVEDDQTWSWLWWGLHEDYSTEVYNGTDTEIMHIDLDYEFAGILAWNDTVAVDAATTNVMNFNSTYSELTHYWMPMDVESVIFVTPGEAWGNMNSSGMDDRALNETISFGVTFQNLTGVAFPYGENSYFDWYDGQYYGSDLSTFSDRPTECNTTELSLDVHFTGVENETETGANSAEVKFDIAIGEWQVDTPDQDPLDGFSLAIAFYSELTVSTESGQSAAGSYVGDTGVPLNNTAAVPSENFTMTSGLSNVAMMSLGGAPYYWGSPTGGNVNVTAQTVPLSAFQSMYVSDQGTSNAATFNVTVEQFYTLISFRWWSGYEVEVDPVFVGYISPGATDTIAPSVSSVQSNPREISGVDNMHLEISAYDTGGSGMNEVKVWDQVINVNYTATYNSGIDAYVVNVPRQTGREGQYYFDYSIVANDGAGNELVASGYTFRFRDNIDPSIVLLDHTNGTDAFSNEIGVVEVQVSDAGGSGVSSVILTYTNDTASYNITMTLAGVNYTAIIPNHLPDAFVSYQVTVYDADGNYVQSSAQIFHFYTEGPDVAGPSLLSLGRQPTGPTSIDVVTISVTVLDGTGVQSAILQYSVNSGAWVNITMSSAGNIYSANIPAQAAGAAVTYRIVAYDTLGNMAISSEQSYTVQTETTTTTEPTEPVEPVPGPRPQDLSSTYMMLAGIGLTMIVILAMVFQRKRRT